MDIDYSKFISHSSEKNIDCSAIFSIIEIIKNKYTKKIECSHLIFLFKEEDLIKLDLNNFFSFVEKGYRTFMSNYIKINGQHYEINHLEDFEDDISFNNCARQLSEQNKSYYVYAGSKKTHQIFLGGNFVSGFDGFLLSSKMLQNASKQKHHISELSNVFFDYRNYRFKNNNNKVVMDGFVPAEISEQELRNDLKAFLENNMHVTTVIHEDCTSNENDEESVDLAIIDYEKRVAIIEVKFFINKSVIENNPRKNKYYKRERILAGYKQLDKYCCHLVNSDANIYSANLYVFYAGEKPHVVKDAQISFYNSYNSSEASDNFKQSYRMTFLDNLIEKNVRTEDCINEPIIETVTSKTDMM